MIAPSRARSADAIERGYRATCTAAALAPNRYRYLQGLGLIDRSLFIPKPDARLNLVAHEAIKLTATYMNGIAIAVLAVGALAPIFAPPPNSDGLAQGRIALQIVCLIGSVARHLVARSFLTRLK